MRSPVSPRKIHGLVGPRLGMLPGVWSGRLWWLARLTAALAGAFALWAYCVNRTLIQLEDFPGKQLVMAAFGLVLAALSALSVLRTKSRRPLVAWLVLLGLFGLGELHRAWLRQSYRADSRGTPVWPAVTTTDVEIRSFRAPLPALRGQRLRVAG